MIKRSSKIGAIGLYLLFTITLYGFENVAYGADIITKTQMWAMTGVGGFIGMFLLLMTLDA